MELLVTIDNFAEDGVVRQINSPRSLEACLRVGLDPAELAPKPFKAFQSSDLTPQMVQIKFDQFERKRKDKIAAVQAERKAVIEYAEKKRQKAIAAAAAAAAAAGLDAAAAAAAVAAGEAEISQALLIEQKRMEALRRRQEKEISKIVERETATAELQKKIKRAEEEEIHKRKLHEKKVAEQKLAAEKKALARLAEIKRLEQEEEERRKEIARKEGEFAEKMKIIALENERRIAKEARERDRERAAKIEEYRKKTEALVQAQAKLAEENRIKMLEREQRVQAQLQLKKEQKRIEVAEAREKAQKRIDEALEKHHEIHIQKKIQFDEKQKKAAILAKENQVIEREKLRKQGEDREKKVKVRYQRLIDAYRIRGEHRQDIINRRTEKDQTFSKVAKERQDHIAMLKFNTALKLKDKRENVERIARVNEFKRLQTLRKIEEADSRYERIQMERTTMINKHREEVKASLCRKHEINDAMETMRINNDFTLLDKLFAKNQKKKATGKGDDDKDDGDDGAAAGATSHGATGKHTQAE